MFILGDILVTLANVLHILLGLYQWIIIIAVIVSWVRPNPSHEVVRTLLVVVMRMTEPVFAWVRQRLPRAFFSVGLDFSPLVVWFAVLAADLFLYRALMNLGMRLSMGMGQSDLFQNIPGQ